MRYLKEYKLFESVDEVEIINFLNDIFLDTIDKGIGVIITPEYKYIKYKKDKTNIIGFIIQFKSENIFKLSDMYDDILTSMDYMRSHGMNLHTFRIIENIKINIDSFYGYMTDRSLDISTRHCIIKFNLPEKKFENSNNTNINELVKDVEMLMGDMVDYGWEYSVSTELPSWHDENEKIIVKIFNGDGNSNIIPDVISERLDQVQSVLPITVSKVQISPEYKTNPSSALDIELDSLDDFKVSDILMDEKYDKISNNSLFLIKDWGMDNWINDMEIAHKDIDEDKIIFISNDPQDDFQTYVLISDIDEDVQLSIFGILVVFELNN